MRETAAGSRRPTWSSSWRVTAGASTASPAATARTASTTSRVGASLSRKPLAPARSASMMYSSSPKVVRISTRWRGSRRVASMPSMPGMRMSISTTSGAVRLGRRDRLLAGAGLGDDLDRAGRLEHGLEAGAHHRLVVGDDDAQPAHDAPP